jgi:tetratricopeptide (TPR) repeat protein
MRSEIIVLIVLISILFGCSTEKNATVNRFYHNTTAYYNGYFNARELIKEKNKEFAKARKEDYTQILPINRFPDEEESKDFFPPMDRAIEKSSKVIAKHAMPREKTARYVRTEYGNWMDENWLIIGQSHFYKREYPKAIEKFEYVIKMYQKNPSKYYAKLWLAKTYIETESYSEAIRYLTEITNEKEARERKDDRKEAKKERRATYTKKSRRKKSRIKVIKEKEKDDDDKSFLVEFPEKLAADLEATYADYFLKKKEYEESLLYLKEAIKLTKRKKLKIRYKFIQGQIYQELGKKVNAFELYSYVIKRNAPYQMIFYSKINRALLANSSDRGGLKKELLKLSKDDKYEEFKDQIYYALGEIELQEQQKDQAVDYFLKSASYPSSNVTQKGKTYIKLADLYFQDKKYMPAQQYYDSSISALPPTYPNYEGIKEKSRTLTDLVGYINVVKMQDSLQGLAGMDEKQRLDKIEEILYAEKIKAEEEKNKQKQASTQSVSINQIASAGDKGKFWMYNPQVKLFGYNEFKSIWGDVALEDDWRRKDKNQILINDNITEASAGPAVSDEEIKAFADKIPVTEKALRESNILILDALYLSGLIYKDKFNDLSEAISSFDDARQRYFLKNSKVVSSMYQLYKTYNDANKYDFAQIVKKQILTNYPNTQEAKILKDPLYSTRLKESEEKEKAAYAEVYSLIDASQNAAAIIKINNILTKDEPNEYRCKLMYLRAKAYGNLQQLDSLEVALTNVVDGCSAEKELVDIAQATLDKLKNVKAKQETEKARDVFVFDAEAEHLFVVLVPNGEYDMNTIKTGFSDFNNNSFKSKGLKVSTTFLNTQTQTVLIKTFSNKGEAQSYYVAYKVNKKELKDFNGSLEYYIISAKNFSQLFITKDIEKYKEFYGKYYVTE